MAKAEPWLCDAGETLRRQIDRTWPRRDKASDGWLGDPSHTTGDHVPDPSSDPSMVVRAIDVDEDLLGPGKPDPDAANELAKQLVRYARRGLDNGRLSYVIFAGRIASRPYGFAWRPYTGDNPHTIHLHISFMPRGDHRGGRWKLPIFKPDGGWKNRPDALDMDPENDEPT